MPNADDRALRKFTSGRTDLAFWCVARPRISPGYPALARRPDNPNLPALNRLLLGPDPKPLVARILVRPRARPCF